MKLKVFIVIICIQILTIIVLFFQIQQKNISKLTTSNADHKRIAIEGDLRMFNSSYSLHPYLCYVLDYETDDTSNKLGFIGEDLPIRNNKDDFVVGIFGGSVAEFYYKYEKDNFGMTLKNLMTNKKNIKIYSFALGGYKQPQQLFTLQYLLLLGYKFDLVINIDGFNEAALAFSENYNEGISSYFPRHWNLYSRQYFDKKTNSLIDTIESLKSKKSFFIHLPYDLGYLPSVILDRQYNQSQLDLKKRLNEIDKTYQTKGPEPYMYKTRMDIEQNIVNSWFNSSIQMSYLAKSNNIQYLEFLQPNQYLSHSKHFTQEELNKYINENNLYASATREIYPKIVEKVQELKKNNVSIFDLTNIFIDEKESIYIDDCCHYNAKGYSLMTEDIVKAIEIE